MRELLQRQPDSTILHWQRSIFIPLTEIQLFYFLEFLPEPVYVCRVYISILYLFVYVCLHVNNQILSLMKGLLAMVCYVTLYLSPQTTSCQRKYHSICSSLFFCFSRCPWVRKMSIKSCKITHYLKSNLVNCANCGDCIYQESNLFFKQLNLCRKHAEMSCHNGQFL